MKKDDFINYCLDFMVPMVYTQSAQQKKQLQKQWKFYPRF
jgi:hypothetical protein